MKVLLIALSLMSLSTFAAEIPGSARHIKISHIMVGKVVTETVQIPCTMPDSDLNCYKPVAWKNTVSVMVDYSTASIAEDEHFKVEFDQELFSPEELKALSVRSAVTRVKLAKKIFRLEIREEERTTISTYCPYEIPYTCRADEEVTDTFQSTIKIVDVIKN